MQTEHLQLVQLTHHLDIEKPILNRLRGMEQLKDFPCIYENAAKPLKIDPAKPWILFLIGPTGSGKDTLMNYLADKNLVNRAKTAVNRVRRVDEPEDAYIFMRKQQEHETLEQYHEHLIKEYELIEHDVHNGYLYGLPKSSLQNADRNKVILIRTEINGVTALTEELKNEFNLVTIFVLPDSWTLIYKRVNLPGLQRTNIATRIEAAVDWIDRSPDVANFYLHNTENSSQYTSEQISGLQFCSETLEKFLLGITKLAK